MKTQTACIWAMALILFSGVAEASAAETRWPVELRYGVLSDYADTRTPRGYVHSIRGSAGYKFTPAWRVDVSGGLRAETIGGQIPKSEEQSHTETLSPSTAVQLQYGSRFWSKYAYSFFLDAEPLWDDVSREEGYRGVLGGGGRIGARLFKGYWSIAQELGLSSLINSYEYGSNGKANPDYFYSYTLTNVFRLWYGVRFNYNFGTRITRYLDGFVGYSYLNSFGLSRSWANLTAALVYENGGFTDNGDISLWYVDQYRRLARFVIAYSF